MESRFISTFWAINSVNVLEPLIFYLKNDLRYDYLAICRQNQISKLITLILIPQYTFQLGKGGEVSQRM